MAEEEERVPNASEVVCAHCNEILREPRLLPCLHSFCSECLSTISRSFSAGSFECPTCKSTVKTENVEQLPLDYWSPILIAQQYKDRAKVRMDRCEKVAVKRCQDCADFLCQECAELHQTYPRFKAHRVFDLDEYEAQPDKGLKHLPCLEHPDKVLETFCEDCGVAACLVCAVFQHNSHTIKKLSEAAVPIKASVATSRAGTEQKLDAVKGALAAVADVHATVQEHQDQLRGQIKTMIAALHEHLAMREAQLISFSDAACDERLRALDGQSRVLDELRRFLVSAITATADSVRLGCDAEVVALAPALRLRLDTLTNTWAPLEPCCGPDVALVQTDAAIRGLQQSISTLGAIQSSQVIIPRDPRRPSSPSPSRNYSVLRQPRRTIALPGEGVGQTRTPFGMCESATGGLLVCDFGNNRLQEIFLDDRAPRVVLTYPSGKGAVAVTQLGDNYAVVDAAHQLRVIRSNGSLLTSVGSKGAGPTHFNCPFDVRVLPSGSLVVSDQLNNRLQLLEASGAKFERTLLLTNVQLNHPRGLAVAPDGTLYVVDHAHDRVIVLTPEGVLSAELKNGPDGKPLERPFAVALDSFGNALVADWGRSRIVVFSPNNTVQAFPTPGHPRSIAIDSGGNVFVALEEGQIIMY